MHSMKYSRPIIQRISFFWTWSTLSPLQEHCCVFFHFFGFDKCSSFALVLLLLVVIKPHVLVVVIIPWYFCIFQSLFYAFAYKNQLWLINLILIVSLKIFFKIIIRHFKSVYCLSKFWVLNNKLSAIPD